MSPKTFFSTCLSGFHTLYCRIQVIWERYSGSIENNAQRKFQLVLSMSICQHLVQEEKTSYVAYVKKISLIICNQNIQKPPMGFKWVRNRTKNFYQCKTSSVVPTDSLLRPIAIFRTTFPMIHFGRATVNRRKRKQKRFHKNTNKSPAVEVLRE